MTSDDMFMKPCEKCRHHDALILELREREFECFQYRRVIEMKDNLIDKLKDALESGTEKDSVSGTNKPARSLSDIRTAYQQAGLQEAERHFLDIILGHMWKMNDGKHVEIQNQEFLKELRFADLGRLNRLRQRMMVAGYIDYVSRKKKPGLYKLL